MTGGRSQNPGSRDVAATGGLLAALVVHNLIYPLSAQGLWGAVLFYALYAGMFPAAAWVLTRRPGLRAAALAAGAAVFVAGIAHAVQPGPGAALAVYVTSVLHHAVIAVVLARFCFRAETVFTEVILAATSLYLVIGSGFAAVFATLEWLTPGAFATSAAGPIGWQQLLYFSYITLTSVGYGDILPVSYHAQALAAFEAVVGVLYTVILLSRLVGMHAARR